MIRFYLPDCAMCNDQDIHNLDCALTIVNTFNSLKIRKMSIQKQIRYIGYMECQTWLNLIDRYAKKWTTERIIHPDIIKHIFIIRIIFYHPKDINFVESEARAKEIIDAKKFNKIKKEIDDQEMDVAIEEMPSKIRELEKQIEELRNLPPVEVEKIQYAVDPIGDTYPADDPHT